jgi:nicotinamidase-related amidase
MDKEKRLIVGKPALLLVDPQQGLDQMASQNQVTLKSSVDALERTLLAARAAGIPVIYFQEIHRKEKVDYGRELDGNENIHCLEGTPWIEIIDRLKPIDGEYRNIKRRYSCFFGTDLDILLRGLGVQTLIMGGYFTDVCVHYTAVDAHQHDYYIRVLHDGCQGSSVEAHEASLRAMTYLQHASKTNSYDAVAAIQAWSKENA